MGWKKLRYEDDPVNIEKQDLVLGDSVVTPLGADSYYKGSSFSTEGYGKIVGVAYSDQPSASGGLKVYQSEDGTNWDIRSEFDVEANEGLAFSVEVVAPYARIDYYNGPTAQNVFRYYAFTRTI